MVCTCAHIKGSCGSSFLVYLGQGKVPTPCHLLNHGPSDKIIETKVSRKVICANDVSEEKSGGAHTHTHTHTHTCSSFCC